MSLPLRTRTLAPETQQHHHHRPAVDQTICLQQQHSLPLHPSRPSSRLPSQPAQQPVQPWLLLKSWTGGLARRTNRRTLTILHHARITCPTCPTASCLLCLHGCPATCSRCWRRRRSGRRCCSGRRRSRCRCSLRSAAAATMLAWGVVDFKQGLDDDISVEQALDNPDAAMVDI